MQDARSPYPEQEAESTRQQGDHQVLGEKLADETESPSTHGSPHSHLRLAHRGAGQEEVGHIRTGNQQHQDHRTHDENQSQSELLIDLVPQGDHLHTPTLIRAGKGLRQAVGEVVHLRLRLFFSDPRFQPSNHHHLTRAAAQCAGAKLERNPQVGVAIEQPETRGHHPDDRVAFAVQCDVTPEDPRISPETALPRRMAQDDHPRFAAFRFVGQEVTTHRRLHAQDVEIIEGHSAARETLRLSHVGEVEGLPGKRGEIFENPVLLPVIKKVRNGQRVPAAK